MHAKSWPFEIKNKFRQALSIEEKIYFIEYRYSSILDSIILPLVIALIYVVVFPYFFWLLDFAVKKAVAGRKKNQTEQKLSDIKGMQETAIEEIELENIKANYREKADLNKQIEGLKEEVLKKDKEIQEKLKTNHVLTAKIEGYASEFHNKDENITALQHSLRKVQTALDNALHDKKEIIEDSSTRISRLMAENEIIDNELQKYRNKEYTRLSNREIDSRPLSELAPEELDSIYKDFKNSPLFSYYPMIAHTVKESGMIPDDLTKSMKEKLIKGNFITQTKGGYYELTDRGKLFYDVVKEDLDTK